MIEFIKAVCQYDVSARPLDMVPRGRVLTVWESCKTVNEVEKKFQAERSIQNLPPQVVQGDFEIAKAALEKLEGYELPKHWLPSKAYFERKLSHVKTFFQAESLSTVTNISQADANEQQTLQFESSSATFKIPKKEFGVAMPQTSEDLRTRLRVMASCAVMVQMRYQSNPLLQSSSIDMFTRYTNFLFGPKGWMLVSLGPDKVPISCPTIHHVMGYDIGLREFVAKQMNNSVPIQKAFENAFADGDLRSTHFTTAVNIDSQKPECRALTAPGITEAYPELLRRGVKRPREVINESGAAASASAASPTSRTAGASKNARNRANKARKKAEETERANAKAAAAAAAIAAAPWGGDRARGRGAKVAKGAKGAGRGAKGGAKGAQRQRCRRASCGPHRHPRTSRSATRGVRAASASPRHATLRMLAGGAASTATSPTIARTERLRPGVATPTRTRTFHLLATQVDDRPSGARTQKGMLPTPKRSLGSARI